MRNLLALAAVLFISFAGLGWYRGWYAVLPQASESPGRSAFLVEVDRLKIAADVGEAARSVQRWLSKGSKEEAKKAPESAEEAEAGGVTD